MKSDIKVSVCVVTYNQEKYIEQCVRSVLEQETKYPFEIVIGDDASTDSTRDILIDLQKQYPDKIRLLLHEYNIGPSDNVLSTYYAAKGEYIAHLDGDDYFLPGKIEAQVNLMDVDGDCGMSFHAVMKLTPDEVLTFEKINCKGVSAKGWEGIDLIWLMALGSNSSKMFKKDLLNTFKDPGFPLVDTVFNCLIIGGTTIKVIDSVAFGVYRSAIGVSSKGSATKIATARGYEYLVKFFPKKFRSIICATVFFLMLIEIKNMSLVSFYYFKVFIKSFHVGFVLKFYHLFLNRQ